MSTIEITDTQFITKKDATTLLFHSACRRQQRVSLTKQVWQASAITQERLARSVMVRTTRGFFSRN